MEIPRNEIVQNLVDAAINYLKNIKPGDSVTIIHGHDNDSICSAAIMYKLIKQISKKDPKLFMTEENFSVNEVDAKKIVKTKSKFFIVLDLSEIRVDVETDLAKAGDVMIIDHHKPKGYARSAYLNPRTYDKEIYLPTTYMCYKIFESYYDPKEIIWIAGVGTLSDMGMKYALDLFQKILLVEKDLVSGSKPVDEDLFDKSQLGKLAKILDSARVIKGVAGAQLALKVLLSTDYKDVLNKKTADSKKLLTYFESVDKEFKKIVANFNKNKKEIKNFLIYEIKSKMNLKSPIASYLPKFFDDKILIIMQKENKMMNVSYRRGKKVNLDLSDLAQALVKDIPNSNGGGHPQAAGGGFPAKYIKDFMKNLTEVALVQK